MRSWQETLERSRGRCRLHIARATLLLIVICMVVAGASAQDAAPPRSADDLIPVLFSVKRLGSTEIMAVPRDTSVLLPLRQVFTFLRIKHDYQSTTNRITGFFVSPETTYAIELNNGAVRVGRRRTQLAPYDYVIRDGDFYFAPEFYRSMFLLPIDYEPRRLQAKLTTRLELPVFLDRRLSRLEARLAENRYLGDPEITLQRRFEILNGFRLDWFLSETFGEYRTPTTTGSARLGLTVLGGDLSSRFGGRLAPDPELFESRHLWRYVPQNTPLVRQILVGDYFSNGLLSREMYGIQVTSVPAAYRVFFAEEEVTGRTLPDRNAYLFNGSVISGISRTGRDAGYSLQTPLRYGANLVDVRSYSEWGELTEENYRITIPQALIPPSSIDYTLNIGRLRERGYPWYGDVSAFWGVSRILTLGVQNEYYGYEFLTQKIYPSVIGVVRITNDIVGEARLSPGALMRGQLLATFPWLLMVNTSLTVYRDVILFNPRGAEYDFDFSFSYPFSVNGLRLGTAALYRESLLGDTRERLLQASLDAYLGIFSPMASFLSAWQVTDELGGSYRTVQEGDLFLRFRLPGPLFLGLGSRYDFIREEVKDFRINVGLRPLERLNLDFSYVRNFQVESSIIRFQLRYFFPFARVSWTTSSVRDRVTHIARANGSVGYSSETSEFLFDHRNRTSFGGFFLRPFLDANNNGVREENETQVQTARPQVSVDRGLFQSTLYRTGKMGWGNPNGIPYREYYVSLPEASFDELYLVPRYRNFVVSAKPAGYAVYDVPVLVGGGVRGSVVRFVDSGAESEVPVEGIKIRIRQVRTEASLGPDRLPLERTVETFSTGEFEFLGLPPGEYEVSVNAAELIALGYYADVYVRSVTIKSTEKGDFVEGVKFVIQALQ